MNFRGHLPGRVGVGIARFSSPARTHAANDVGMTILLVRHGETAGNASRILQRADVPLNERGMRQAEQLARRLFDHGFVHIVCSDLLRARMTAAPLAARSGIAIEENPLLEERNFGDLRGVPYAELTENPFGPDFAPPNGEDWPTFHSRVADAFDFMVSRRRSVNGTMVVVTHGLVCRALVERHALLPEGVVAPERFDNTSVTVLHEDAPHATSLINCTRHLVTALEVDRDGGPA
jgi:probable phosphoglycerate mutase